MSCSQWLINWYSKQYRDEISDMKIGSAPTCQIIDLPPYFEHKPHILYIQRCVRKFLRQSARKTEAAKVIQSSVILYLKNHHAANIITFHFRTFVRKMLKTRLAKLECTLHVHNRSRTAYVQQKSKTNYM